MTRTTFQVSNMHCSARAITLEGFEDELDGVKRVSASYRKQQVEVEFDEAVVTINQIVEAMRELGYNAKAVS